MTGLMNLLLGFIRDCFRSRGHLHAEILVLRHQLNILRRKTPKRLVFSSTDRALFAWLYRVRPGLLNALVIVQPGTVIQGIARVGVRGGAGNPGTEAGAPRSTPNCAI